MRDLLAVLTVLSAFALAAGAADAPAPAAPQAGKVPVIFDTDIGDDIDDSWALVMLLRDPRAEVKLVTTTYGRQDYRGKLLARLLTVAGRTDVAVGLGAGELKGTANQQDYVKDYDLSSYAGKVHKDGVQALIDTVHASSQPVTIIAVGPLNTLAAALAKDPSIAPKVNLYGMHGSVRKGYGGKATSDAEWNVKQAVKEAQAVFSAPWKKMVITPLDTCGLVQLRGPDFMAVRTSADPLAAALIENYRMWARKKAVEELTSSSTLFDTVAVYLALSDLALVEIENLTVAVDDKGFTRIDPAGRTMGVATAWKDLKAYHQLLARAAAGGK